FYLDDKDVHNSAAHVGDGFPDRNPLFGGLFVNAGDPKWFDTVDAMTADGPDGRSGLRELLTPNYGRGLNCDGVFLDTIDTAAPNSYTNASSANQTEYEWTAPGFGAFIRRVHDTYPTKLVLQNRGVFFFDPRMPQYKFNARGAIDFLLFESYRLSADLDLLAECGRLAAVGSDPVPRQPLQRRAQGDGGGRPARRVSGPVDGLRGRAG